MSDIKVVLVHAEAREERTVTTGTRAWELYADDPTVIAARVGGALKDLAHELADGDEVEGVAIDSSDGRDILRGPSSRGARLRFCGRLRVLGDRLAAALGQTAGRRRRGRR